MKMPVGVKIEGIREIARKILEVAGRLPLQIFIRVKRGALVRFTNNGIHQNGFQDFFTYTLRAVGKKGPAWISSNDFSESGIQEALKRIQPVLTSAPQSPSKAQPRGSYARVKEHFSLNLKETPEMAAQAIEEAVRLIRLAQSSANGYYSAYERLFYLRDSSGLELFHPATAARFGVTVTKGAGKGYLSFYHPNPMRLKVAPLVEQAVDWADRAARAEITVKPGEYECILSPRALLELMEPLRRHFDRRLTEDGKSVFSGLLGKRVFSENFSLADDVAHAGQFGVPFDAEGAPRRPVALVSRGVLRELLAEGHSTRGLLEHPLYPQNLVVEKGSLSLEEIFSRIRRGFFINKIWYHTVVRESRMEVTGLATAGCLSIERGQVRGRAVHLRYHDSIFSILRSVVGATREQILLKDGEMGAALFPYLWIGRLRVV